MYVKRLELAVVLAGGGGGGGGRVEDLVLG